MAYASTVRAASAPSIPVPTVAAPGLPRPIAALWSRLVLAMIDQRRRQALRELRRHQAFGPLVNVMHIGLTRAELIP